MSLFEEEVTRIVDRKTAEITAVVQELLKSELEKFKASLVTSVECAYVDKSRHRCHRQVADSDRYCARHSARAIIEEARTAGVL